FTLAKIIKKENEKIPLVFLTARNMVPDKINGFKTGADDYVVKPFDIHELLFRIKAILRRTNGEANIQNKEKKLGGYKFNPLTRELIKDETILKLSAKEADLLNLFIDNKNQM